MSINSSLSQKKLKFSGLFSFCLFLLIWPMFVGPSLAVLNPSFFGGPEVTNLTLSSALYAARNLAVGFAFFLAIYLRNASMLFILILIRFITDLIDAPAFFSFRDPDLLGLIIIFSICCYLPALFGLSFLWKHMRIKT